MMNRRDAVKTISMSFGCTVATPTLLGILNSCNDHSNDWNPVFLSESHIPMIDTLVNIILPKSETLAGLELNITQFIDKMMANTEAEKNQQLFKNGGLAFESQFNDVYKKDILKGTENEFSLLIDTFFNVPKEQEQEVFKQLTSDIDQVPEEKHQTFLTYSFLTKVRYYCLLGYFTSQPILQNELNYNVNLGYYKGCIDL